MAQQKAKKTKKQRKHGRGKNYCLKYALSHRREHNKLIRLGKHLKKFPDDMIAQAAVEACRIAIRGY